MTQDMAIAITKKIDELLGDLAHYDNVLVRKQIGRIRSILELLNHNIRRSNNVGLS